MAYQARRMKKVIEEFELVDENGQVIERLHVELDAGSMLEKLRKKYVNLVRAQQSVQKIELDMGDEKVLEGYNVLGAAVCDLIEAVFGKEDTQKIMKFYGAVLSWATKSAPRIFVLHNNKMEETR